MFGKIHSSINMDEEVPLKPQNKFLSSPKTIFKYQHLSPSTSESLPVKIFTDKEKFQIGRDFGPTTDDDKLIELLPRPHMKSTTPTAATLTHTTSKDRMASEAMHFFIEYYKPKLSKSPPTSKAEYLFNRIQTRTSTMKMKDFYMKDNVKLSLSEWEGILSSMDQISNTDSKDKNIKISKIQTLFTALEPSLTTKFQPPKSSEPWHVTKHAKDDKKLSTTNITREVLGKYKTNQSLSDTKLSTVATTRLRPKVVLDYFSVTISKPFGAFDLSKDIPSYLSAKNWQKSRLPVIETKNRGQNRPSNPRFSRNSFPRTGNLVSQKFITSTNQQPKLRKRTVESKTLTIKQRNEELSSRNFKVPSLETHQREHTRISRRPNPTNVQETHKRKSKESLFESTALKEKTYKFFRNLVFPAYELFQNTRSSSKHLKINLDKIYLKNLMNNFKVEKNT